MTLFANRQEAGAQLAAVLTAFKDRDPVVLALPRGGVVVGFAVAQALNAPLDIVLVRKIGAPWQPELAVGAVVDGEPPDLVVNDDIVRLAGVGPDYVEREAAHQLQEIERRRALYGGTRQAVTGRTALVVDDGIATGATVRAALRALRRRSPAHLVLAVPVAPPDTVALLKAEVDDVVCLATPVHFGAIGYFYDDFTQVEDAEVIALLDRAGRSSALPTVPED